VKPADLDDQLGALLDNREHQFDPARLLKLGHPALERLLDCIEGKATLRTAGQTETQWRDSGDWRTNGVAAFARDDPDSVLRAMKARRWSDLQIARSGIASVPDPRVLPYLLSLIASEEPLDRSFAVNCLSLHRDPLAIDTLIAALKDRSSGVRSAAVSALGEVGDPRALQPLRLFAERCAKQPRSAWLACSAQEEIRKIRSKARARAP